MRPLAFVLGTGLLVGSLDLLAACMQYYLKTGNGPTPVLKFIASGVFGADAFTGGDRMIVYGLLFHYSLAVSFTLFFFLICAVFPTLSKAKVTRGVVYGAAIWLVMNLIILPLSNTPKTSLNWIDAGTGVLILIVCIGLPLSFIAARQKI